MKCYICHKNGNFFCNRISHNICLECCHKEQSIEVCDNNCINLSKEIYSYTSPKEITFFQVSNGKSVVFSENLFLPNIFHYLSIDISNYKIDFISFNRIKVSFNFFVKSNVERNIKISEAYCIDSWKPHYNDKIPFLQVISKTKFDINNIELSYNEDIKETIIVENNHLDTWLPFTKINYERLSENEINELNTGGNITSSFVYYGSHFENRNSTFYAKILENHNYFLSFEIANVSGLIDKGFIVNSFGLFLPFHHVNFSGLNYSCSEDLNYNLKFMKLQPLDNRVIYAFLTPIDNKDFYDIRHKNRLFLNENCIKEGYKSDDYSILYHSLAFTSAKTLFIDSRINKIPLCLSLYDDINKIFDNDYAPVSVEVLNIKNNIIQVSISVKIDDLTSEWIEIENVGPMESKIIKVVPTLLSNLIVNIDIPTYKGLLVTAEYNGKTVYKKSHRILVYPKNYFLFELKSVYGDWKIEMKPYIAKWVTPHCNEVAKVISKAKEYGYIEGYTDNRKYNIEELKHIYDSVADNMKYVNRSYAIMADDNFIQKILLPTETLKYKCGNCIDLTVALASCYEEIGFNPYIVLIKEHAFLRIKISSNEFINIESTCLGSYSFEESIEIGKKEYNENFNYNGQAKNDSSFIVDIKLSRDAKILPME